MLINSHVQPNPETQARQALVRVYALLIKLAEIDPQDATRSEPQEVMNETNPAE